MATTHLDGVTLDGPLASATGTRYTVSVGGQVVGVVASHTIRQRQSVGRGRRLTRTAGTVTRWAYGLGIEGIGGSRPVYHSRRDALDALITRLNGQEG